MLKLTFKGPEINSKSLVSIFVSTWCRGLRGSDVAFTCSAVSLVVALVMPRLSQRCLGRKPAFWPGATYVLKTYWVTGNYYILNLETNINVIVM